MKLAGGVQNHGNEDLIVCDLIDSKLEELLRTSASFVHLSRKYATRGLQ